MADLKISALTELAAQDLDSDDVLAVVNLGTSATRKIRASSLINRSVAFLSGSTISGSAIDFSSVTISGSSIASGTIATSNIANDAITAVLLANNSSAVVSGALPASGSFTGQFAITSGDSSLYAWDGGSWTSVKAAGSISSISGIASGIVNIGTVTTSGNTTISGYLSATTSGSQFLAGPLGTGGAVYYRGITAADLPAATTTEIGGVIVNGNGLVLSGSTIAINNTISTASGFLAFSVNQFGVVTHTRAVTGSDLPIAQAGIVGAVQPGTGLNVNGAGSLGHSNTIASGTTNGFTFDSEGHITNAIPLVADNIPSLPASKITTGTLNPDLLGTNSITGVKLGDGSTVQFGGANNTTGIVSFPIPQFDGQYFWDATNKDLYIYDGNTWQPVTITSGELILAGTYNATTNRVASVTTAGSALGLTIGGVLPAAASANERYYLVVAVSGTGVSPAPAVALAPPDMLLSNGTTWELIDVSNAIAGQTAVNISFTPYGNLAASDVQAALQELDDEKFAKAGGTITGELLIGTAGSLKFEGSSADAYETEIAVVNPTLDRTVTLPDQSGTVLLAGNASIVNADVSASAGIAFSKLESLASANILVGNSSNVPTSRTMTGDVEISNTGVTSIASNVIVDADVNASAAITGTKIQQGSTSVRGTLHLTDSATSTSTTTAATPNAVKTAYDLADAALAKSGGTMTGVIAFASGQTIAGYLPASGGTMSGAITFASGQTIAGYLPASGGTMTGAVTFASSQTFPRIPQNSKTSAYTLIASDIGKHISITTGGVAVPSGVFAVGDAISIYNNSANTQTITQNSGVTLRLAGSANTGNRSLAQYGVCTVLCVDTNVFVATGAGIN